MIKIEFNEPEVKTGDCNLSLTDSALKKLQDVFKNKHNQFLRLKVISGGCNGFSYSFDITEKQNNDDILVEINNIRILLDNISSNYVQDATIDFVEELQASHFKVINPNATSSCSCGTSFSI